MSTRCEAAINNRGKNNKKKTTKRERRKQIQILHCQCFGCCHRAPKALSVSGTAEEKFPNTNQFSKTSLNPISSAKFS
jgi:hypothetical protein